MQHYNFVCCKSQQNTVGLVDVLFWTVPDSQYINPQIPMATLAHCVPECYYLNSIRCKHLFSLRQKMQHLSGTERSAWDRKMCLRQKLQQLPGTERSVKVKVPFSTAVQPTWPGHGFNFRLWDKKKKKSNLDSQVDQSKLGTRKIKAAEVIYTTSPTECRLVHKKHGCKHKMPNTPLIHLNVVSNDWHSG